jgi:hypothetical protein
MSPPSRYSTRPEPRSLATSPAKVPYVIGLAGSVAVGKSTTARILRELLAHWPEHPKVDLVTTDGFLVDAPEVHTCRGYIERFLLLRATAFKEPASYFHRYAALSDEAAEQVAGKIWDTTNGPNLCENILPTRERAHLILVKGPDHAVETIRLRKLWSRPAKLAARPCPREDAGPTNDELRPRLAAGERAAVRCSVKP